MFTLFLLSSGFIHKYFHMFHACFYVPVNPLPKTFYFASGILAICEWMVSVLYLQFGDRKCNEIWSAFIHEEWTYITAPLSHENHHNVGKHNGNPKSNKTKHRIPCLRLINYVIAETFAPCACGSSQRFLSREEKFTSNNHYPKPSAMF